MLSKLPDTLKLYETVTDGYGDKSISSSTDIRCLFLQTTSNSHSGNREVIDADAHAYLDITNPAVTEKGFRLEGMHVYVNLFEADESECWYRISRVQMGQRKLLTNEIDNIHVFLRKVAKPQWLLV